MRASGHELLEPSAATPRPVLFLPIVRDKGEAVLGEAGMVLGFLGTGALALLASLPALLGVGLTAGARR